MISTLFGLLVVALVDSSSVSDKKCFAPVWCNEGQGSSPDWMQIFPQSTCHKDHKVSQSAGTKCDCNDITKRVATLERENSRLQKLVAGYGRAISHEKPANSCRTLKKEGNTVSRVYKIQPDEKYSAIEVFCDMESAGGGWTLVASVHPSHRQDRFTTEDKWTTYNGGGNWENFNTFGTPESATSSDYKSQAYYSLKASDMMVWHVLPDTGIKEVSSMASLKYHTNTGFLEKYGGNLRTLFHDYFPLTNDLTGNQSLIVRKVIQQLSVESASLIALVPDFHNYAYDGGTPTLIHDGGSDMFDDGNIVSYRIGRGDWITITYGNYYRNASEDVELISSATHPFHALMWIGNRHRLVRSFAFRVNGNAGADRSGKHETIRGNILLHGYNLTYYAFGVSGAGDPSICKVFYYVESHMWGSVISPATMSPWTAGTELLSHGLAFSDWVSSILVGYTLLSRTGGHAVGESTIRSVLSKILQLLQNSAGAFCKSTEEVLVQPVAFLKGDDSEVLNRIPEIYRQNASDPGFIQFRAYDGFGFASAFCPGVRTSSCRPEQVCLGGVDRWRHATEFCSELAGCQINKNSGLGSRVPEGYRRTDNSTILIFTRNNN